MNQPDLLTEYVKTGDQRAFADLVDAYIGIAYSAAFACLQKDDLARDAVQLTFVELAKKAPGMRSSVKLGGWVHLTARNISKKILRAELRRKQREARYEEERTMDVNSEPDWSRLTPEIHDALAELADGDREIILLRYFQGRSFAETAATLGLTTDAARMRTNRALERLNSSLGRMGIVSTATALGAALPVHAVTAVPQGLTTTVSTAAFGATGVGLTAPVIGTGFLIMKTKTTIVATTLVLSLLAGTKLVLDRKPQSPDPETASAEAVEPGQDGTGSQTVVKKQDPSVARAGAWEPPADLPEVVESGVEAEEQAVAPLEIREEYLAKAKKTAGFMKLAIGLMDSDLVMNAVAEQSEVAAPGLALRLGLPPEAGSRVNDALAAHSQAEADRLKKESKIMVNAMKTLMNDNREGFEQFIALQLMKEAGEPLNDAQESFMQNLVREVQGGAGAEDFGKKQEWYESEDLLNVLNEELSPEQAAEFDRYVEETKTRATEEKAYKRTQSLAGPLGLDEEERTALYTYLYQNPDATDEEVASLLGPELASLMPRKKQLIDMLGGVQSSEASP